MPTTPFLPRPVLVVAGLMLFAAACSWSVPADPGLNSRVRGRSDWVLADADAPPDAQVARIDPAARDDAGARDIYLRKCSQCHEPFQPTFAPAAGWPPLVRKYAPRAGLFGVERRRVEAWLMANAR